MAKMGRPAVKIDPKQVEKLAAVLSQAQIADFYGLKPRGLRDRLSKNAALSAAYKRGRAIALMNVGGVLLNQALAGDKVCAMFYLKTQGGWRETRDTDGPEKTGPLDPAEAAAQLRKEMMELDRRDGIVD